MTSKRPTVDRATAARYIDALENHVLPKLGELFFDALRPADVQDWVNTKLRDGYAVETVHGWFRVLRTMVRDAIMQLDLPRDPTLRISFPEAREREHSNALTPSELASFLKAWRELNPQHYALVATLAFTGLRFCHASALKWEDLDEAAGVLRIQRKQVRRHVGPVTRKKRAPKEIPLVAELASILHEHRQMLADMKAPGLAEGWMFPSEKGTLRVPSSLQKAWPNALKAAGIKLGFTVHGLRRTFNDLMRRGRDGRHRHALDDGARDGEDAGALLVGWHGLDALRVDERAEVGAWRSRGGARAKAEAECRSAEAPHGRRSGGAGRRRSSALRCGRRCGRSPDTTTPGRPCWL